MSNSRFGEVMQKIPLPVSVVAVGRGGVENALTVSWVTPVSFEPPQLLISIDKGHYSVGLLKSTKSFVINLLGDDQKGLAGHFARQSFTDQGKLEAVATQEAPSGAAILPGAVAYFDCEVVATHEAGDHLLFVGEVTDAGVLNDRKVLTTESGIRYQKS